MNSKAIPIAKPTITPAINPISKSESDALFDVIDRSLSEITKVELSCWIILVEFSVSITIKLDEGIFSELKIPSFSLSWKSTMISEEIFVNFAERVIGSTVEFPPNKVEWVNRV